MKARTALKREFDFEKTTLRSQINHVFKEKSDSIFRFKVKTMGSRMVQAASVGSTVAKFYVSARIGKAKIGKEAVKQDDRQRDILADRLMVYLKKRGFKSVYNKKQHRMDIHLV